MPPRPIVAGADHPILRARAQSIAAFGKDLQRLVRDLLDTVDAAKGAGLAAPQIGEPHAVCVARVAGAFITLVNPKILWCSETTLLGEEGCLSLPDIWLMVPRASEIVVRYLDERGRGTELHLRDFDARVVQHEVDHLLGKLIVDYRAEVAMPSGEAL